MQTFNDYQVRVIELAEPVDAGVGEMVAALADKVPGAATAAGGMLKLSYASLGLAGEAGEVADKIKKLIRDKGGNLSDEDRIDIAREVGDTVWYAAYLCHLLGILFGDVAAANIAKLKDRKERGKLQGSGDNR